MRIALINPITQTVDRPESFWSLFGHAPREWLKTDREINYVKLAQAIARQGHEVCLFVSDCYRPETTCDDGQRLRIRYLPTKLKFLFPPAYIPLLPSLYRELKKGKFDCIQTTELYQPSTLIAALACRSFFVWEELDQFFSRPITRLLQKLHHQTIEKWLRRKTFVIPRSHSSRQFLKQRGWNKIESVIPSPVDTEVFKPLPSIKTEDDLLVVSRIGSKRGLDFLLEVMREIIAIKPTVKLRLLGGGPWLSKFRQEIRAKGLDPSIKITDNYLSHSEVNRIYNSCALSLVVTKDALYPFVVAESMAAGRPVISRLKKGLTNLIQDDRTGYFADTPSEMAQKILWLLSNDAKRLQMGEAARRVVLHSCSLNNIASRFLNLYQQKMEAKGENNV